MFIIINNFRGLTTCLAFMNMQFRSIVSISGRDIVIVIVLDTFSMYIVVVGIICLSSRIDASLETTSGGNNIECTMVHLSRGAGPCRVDGSTLKEWLLCHEVSSECLREEMAHWVVWLSNDSPPFAAYCAVNLARMLAADKKPGVRPLPLACMEIWMRLWADCLNTETKIGATTACGNINLCAGLQAGIEGNLHAVRAV